MRDYVRNLLRIQLRHPECVVVCGVLIGLLAFYPILQDSSLEVVSFVAIVSSFVALVCVARTSPSGVWSPAFWFLFVLVLFHLGLCVFLAWGQDPVGADLALLQLWINEPTVVPSIYASTIAVVVFAMSLCLTLRTQGRFPAFFWDKPSGLNPGDLEDRKIFGVAGAFMVILGAAIFFAQVAYAAPELLLGSDRMFYLETVDGTRGQQVGTLLLSIGAILLAASKQSRLWWFGVSVFCLFAGWTLFAGARTLALYVGLTAFLIFVRGRRMPRPAIAVAILVIGLSVVNFFGQSRIADAKFEASWLDPRGAVAEMGGSLRPVHEIVAYVDDTGDLRFGGTYVAAAQRMVERTLGIPRPPGLEDPRFAGAVLEDREVGFQIGFSAVAEAYQNGRIIGVIVVFGFFGWIMARLCMARSTAANDALLGIVFYALIYHVRQPSNSLTAWIGFGAFVVILLAYRKYWTALLAGLFSSARRKK